MLTYADKPAHLHDFRKPEIMPASQGAQANRDQRPDNEQRRRARTCPPLSKSLARRVFSRSTAARAPGAPQLGELPQ
ncbi:hypothetical protein I545_4289 [Mycobacterium kansasii 662]|uniref:Uncharacterized protein n=2 Tax=Mycobacterium kansasii TaxID=1768 RepID=A0A1V3X9A1_MYCKA|nr:hypothetical protein I547_7502 [Mycobacterium kansasii 824]EUA16450.1 hypothetical protein I545_4289 [Mycobacterium kansasii 662]KEP40783.1 hypothetical protein MKSMC1_40680 [Mycobacterium kansasii]OOK72926.1 hypothetical protein BZL29_4959 [Mycobacterium kansasii]OOK75785.1 hypothetical protein BZL30_3258 [Mycobacterium kansasii]